MKITPKQQNFCQQYVVDFNGRQAAIRAGYSASSAKETAYQLLQKPTVEAFVKELSDRIAESCFVSSVRVVQKITEIAFDDEQRTGDQLKALELLTKHFGREDENDEDGFEVRHVFEFPHNNRDSPE